MSDLACYRLLRNNSRLPECTGPFRASKLFGLNQVDRWMKVEGLVSTTSVSGTSTLYEEEPTMRMMLAGGRPARSSEAMNCMYGSMW
jgi:hypothetical protein